MHMCLQVYMWRPEGTLGILLSHSLLISLREGLSLNLELGWEPSSPSEPPAFLPSINVSRMQRHA